MQVDGRAECQAGSWAGLMVQKEGWMCFDVNFAQMNYKISKQIYISNNTLNML